MDKAITKHRVFSYNNELVVAIDICYDTMVAKVVEYHTYRQRSKTSNRPLIGVKALYRDEIFSSDEVKTATIENLDELSLDQRQLVSILYE